MAAKADWSKLAGRIESVYSRASRERYEQCSLEGVRVFERAMRAGVRPRAALVLDAFMESEAVRDVHLRRELRACDCELVSAPDEVFAKLTQGRSLGGILGLASLPKQPTLADLFAGAALGQPTFLIGVGLDDPGNMGAMVRTAHALNASALLTAGSTDPFHPKAVRTSMGSVFRLPILQRSHFGELAQEMKAHGVRLFAAVTSGGTAMDRMRQNAAPAAMVMGSEAFGLGPAELKWVDVKVSIPMSPEVDSLSVNAAAAILMYELDRLRRG